MLWKYSRTILKLVLAKFLHRLFENIQRLFCLQNCLSRKPSTISRKLSKTAGQQPAAAISSSNQQQQPAATTSSSNQQQQPAAATSNSNQQQHSTAAINIRNNQLSSYQQYLHNPRRPPLVITTVPSRGYVRLEVDLGLPAR